MYRSLFSLLLVVAVTQSTLVAQTWQSLPDNVPAPSANLQMPEKVELGKKLFFDPRLSLTGTVSCNSCHNIMEGGDDGRPTSMGINGLTGERNAPTVWNAGFQASQFWDGRVASLEDQSKGPIVAAPEMGMPNHEFALERIRQVPGYKQEFQQVFGTFDSITIDHVAEAIAAFERTLITPGSRFDDFVEGDASALSAEAQQGMRLFDEIGCTECHSGPAFNGWTSQDEAPEFVEFPRFDSSHVEMYELKKDRGRFEQQVQQLIAFLSSLEGPFPEITLPRIPSNPGASIISESNSAP